MPNLPAGVLKIYPHLPVFLLVFLLGSTIALSQSNTPRGSNKSASFIRHTVKPGQTFSSISKRYNVDPEILSAFNYMENYKGSVIALYLYIPLTKVNFSSNPSASDDEISVPVFRVRGYNERLLKIRSMENLNMPGNLYKWSNPHITENKRKLVLDGYLHTSKKNITIFDPVRLAESPKLQNTNITNVVPADTLETGLKSANIDSLIADKNDTLNRTPINTSFENSTSQKKKFVIIGKDAPVVRVRSEKKWIPYIKVIVACVLILIIAINLYIFKKKRDDFAKRDANNVIDDIITGAILEEPGNEDLKNKIKSVNQWIKSHLSDKQIQQLVVDKLLTAKKSFKGSTAINLIDLYEHLQLNLFSLKKLNDKKWQKKVSGIYELAIMDQYNMLSQILEQVNHSNGQVRLEAQSAIVKLSGFEGLTFLNNLKHPLSEWQQMKLVDQLSKFTPDENIDFSIWLKSSNESVIIFCLKIISTYQQRGLYNNVIELLYHPSAEVRVAAIKSIRKIGREETPWLLQEEFLKQDKICRLLILKVLGEIGGEDQIPFFKSQLSNPDDSIKLAAADALVKCSAIGLKVLGEFCFNKKSPYMDIYFHAKEGIK